MKLRLLAVLYIVIPPPLALGSQVTVQIWVPLFSNWMLCTGNYLTVPPIPLSLSLAFHPLSYLLISKVIFGIQFGFNREEFPQHTVIAPLWTEDMKWCLEL